MPSKFRTTEISSPEFESNMPYEAKDDAGIGTPLSEKMISEALKEQGYRTSAIGKWHVGDHPDLHPSQQVFDYWFGFVGGGMNYWGKADGPLKNDSYEPKDISSDHPEIVKELERVYKEWDAKNIPPGWEDPHEENVIKEQLRLKAAREKAMRPKGK